MGMGESTENKGMKQGQEEMGHFISVCVCLCVCISMYLYSCAVALCALYVGVLNTGSDVDISDSMQHKKKAAKERK